MSSYHALPFMELGDVESRQREYQDGLELRERAYILQPGLQLARSIREPPINYFPGIDPRSLERRLQVFAKQQPKPTIH